MSEIDNMIARAESRRDLARMRFRLAITDEEDRAARFWMFIWSVKLFELETARDRHEEITMDQALAVDLDRFDFLAEKD
jgi:hypothetical protein